MAGTTLATTAVTWTLVTHLVGIATLSVLGLCIAALGALTLWHISQICLWCIGESELALLAFAGQCTAVVVLARTTTTAASTTAPAATSITAFAARVAAFALTLGNVWALLACG